LANELVQNFSRNWGEWCIRRQTFPFATHSLSSCYAPHTKFRIPSVKQLVDSAGSIGNNREEALGGSSHKEFIRYNEFALRAANESVRWLRACAARRLGSPAKCIALLDEGRQMARILAQIVITAKRNSGELGSDGKPGE